MAGTRLTKQLRLRGGGDNGYATPPSPIYSSYSEDSESEGVGAGPSSEDGEGGGGGQGLASATMEHARCACSPLTSLELAWSGTGHHTFSLEDLTTLTSCWMTTLIYCISLL